MRYEFHQPDRCVAGTVGQPGERAFFIQVRLLNRVLSVAVEKAQVKALSDRLEVVIAELRKSDPLIVVESTVRDDAPLETPVESEFVVGAISLAWDETLNLITLELFEIEQSEQGEQDQQGELGKTLEIKLSLGQAQAFVTRSKALINAGRVPCPFCSIPIDPRGHLCPRANGYRR